MMDESSSSPASSDDSSNGNDGKSSSLFENFTLLQEGRRLPKPLENTEKLCTLCPSMDLIALGLGRVDSSTSGSLPSKNQICAVETIHIHRTVSWQKLLTLGPSELSASTAGSPTALALDNVFTGAQIPTKDSHESIGILANKIDVAAAADNVASPSEDENNNDGATCMTWSPDGRAMAVGMVNGRVHLYHVESSGAKLVHATAPATFDAEVVKDVEELTAIGVGRTTVQETNSEVEPQIQKERNVNANTNTTASATSISAPSPVMTRSRAAAKRRELELKAKQSRQQQVSTTTTKQQRQQQQLMKPPAPPQRRPPLAKDRKPTAPASPKEKTFSFVNKRTRTRIIHIRRPSSMEDSQHSQVIGICWAKRILHPQHVPQLIEECDDSDSSDFDEEEMEETWAVQQRFLGRASFFLPATPSYEIVLTDNRSGSASAADGGSGKGAVDDRAGTGSSHNIIRNGTTGPPSHTTPLNILCVAGRSNSLSVYLHGRYRILTLIPPNVTAPALSSSSFSSHSSQIVCAPDLSCIVVAPSIVSQSCESSESSSTPVRAHTDKKHIHLVHWYSTPVLSRRHHDLSFLSSSYSFVSANLHGISDKIEQVTNLWNEMFRPMETKWNDLSKLLTSYGVVNNPTENGNSGQGDTPATISTSTIGNACRTQLRHVLVMGLNGSRAKEGSAASAMNQFLGHLNEHGLMRLLKSLEANLAAAEDLIRQSILAPAQALVYHCGSELLGMTKAQCKGSGNGCLQGEFLLDNAVVQQALTISRILYVAAERLVRDIVTIHHRLKDLLRWMVWQIQCVKMQQTLQEEGKNTTSHNTNMARPPQAVLDRVITFLSDRGLHGKAHARSVAKTSPSATTNISDNASLLTEVILGVHVISDHFVASSDEVSENVTGTELSSLYSVVQSTQEMYQKLFAGPRVTLSNCIQPKVLRFPDSDGNTNVALHRRFGVEASAYMQEGLFHPFLHGGDAPKPAILRGRNWMLFAQGQHNDGDALKGEAAANAVHLVALPSGWNHEGRSPSHYLTAFVQLPTRPSTASAVTVRQVAFYGDDGHSSLSVLSEQSNLQDATSGLERRQRLAVLVDITEKSETTTLVTEELWLVDYSNAIFRQENIDNNEHADDGVLSILPRVSADACSTSTICFGSHEDEIKDKNIEPGVLATKRRIIQTKTIENDTPTSNSTINTSCYVGCGSRGVGCVVSNHTVLGLYDLEEDEESDDDADESIENDDA